MSSPMLINPQEIFGFLGMTPTVEMLLLLIICAIVLKSVMMLATPIPLSAPRVYELMLACTGRSAPGDLRIDARWCWPVGPRGSAGGCRRMEDRDIVEKIRNGDKAAFKAAILEHQELPQSR